MLRDTRFILVLRVPILLVLSVLIQPLLLLHSRPGKTRSEVINPPSPVNLKPKGGRRTVMGSPVSVSNTQGPGRSKRPGI